MSLISGLIPIIGTILGIIVAKYSFEEIKDKKNIFKIVLRISVTLFIAIILYNNFENNFINLSITYLVSLLIFYFLINKKYSQHYQLLQDSFLGATLGYYGNEWMISFLISTLFFIEGNLFFLKKKDFKKRIIQKILFYGFFLITYFMYNPLISYISIAGLTILVIKFYKP